MSEQDSVGKNSLSRRDFLKLLGAGGVALAFTPFVDWGKYMPNPQSMNLARAQVILPDGTHANVNSFPVNHAATITYPSSGDSVLDKEPFKQWQLIRLPAELGGAVNDVSAFRVYSMVCLHLWCLWQYKPITEKGGNNKGQCPCHASTYDPLTGKAIEGPASLQAPPSNVLATLHLETDTEGNLWIKPATWDLYKNGIIGYGRLLAT